MWSILPKLGSTEWFVIDEAESSQGASPVPSFRVISLDISLRSLNDILPQIINAARDFFLIKDIIKND